MRRLAIIVAALALSIAVISLVLWQARIYRVQPGPVRFEIISLTGDRIPARVQVNGRTAMGFDQYEQGNFPLDVEAFGRPVSIHNTGELRVSGEPIRRIQTVTIRLWPWTWDRLRGTTKVAVTEANQLSKTREVTVQANWPDGGVAADVFITCGGITMRTDGLGSARCGRMEGNVLVVGWHDKARSTSGLIPPGGERLSLIIEP